MLNPLAVTSDGLLGNGSISIASRGYIAIAQAARDVVSAGGDIYRRIREEDDRIIMDVIKMFMERI